MSILFAKTDLSYRQFALTTLLITQQKRILTRQLFRHHRDIVSAYRATI